MSIPQNVLSHDFRSSLKWGHSDLKLGHKARSKGKHCQHVFVVTKYLSGWFPGQVS